MTFREGVNPSEDSIKSLDSSNKNRFGIEGNYMDLINSLWDYEPESQEIIPGWNMDASGKKEIKPGIMVRLSDKGKSESYYEDSDNYENVKTLFGTVESVSQNGAVKVRFEDLEKDPHGPIRTCSHDWLIVESD